MGPVSSARDLIGLFRERWCDDFGWFEMKMRDDESGIDFVDLDAFAASGVPHDKLTRLRNEEPVFWHANPDGGGFWLISRHEDVMRISRDWKNFSSDMANGGILGLTDRERMMRDTEAATNTLITMDPPVHGKYRRFVAKAMLPSAIAKVENHVRKISIEMIEAALEKDSFDFVDTMAAWIPLEALAELGDIPILDRKQMFDYVNTIVGPDDPEFARTPEQLGEATASLRNFCIELYRSRHASPGDNILSMMIDGRVDGEPVSEDRVVSFFELLLTAGSETTQTAITHGALAFARFPDQFQIVREHPELLKSSAVEEILRWATPVTYFRRGVMADCEIRGQRIKAGETVMMCYASANRDERVFDNPFSFDIQRQSNPHVSFGGRGPHHCLGANLARMELRVFFEELSKRVSEIRLMGQPDYLRSNLTNGIKHLNVNFQPA